MSSVATLVSGSVSFDPRVIEHLAVTTKAQNVIWLADQAVDLFFENPSCIDVRSYLSDHLKNVVCDVFVQSTQHRRKKLLIADMESTIIEQEMLDELAGALGIGEKVSEITRRAMNGELDFKTALVERVGLLKNQPESLLAKASQKISIMPGAKSLVTTMKAHGAQCWLVSGGFTYFVDPIARMLGFDRAYANDLCVQKGVITGDVAEPILDKNAKKIFLEKACVEYGVSLAETVTVGDGANDVPMLQASNAGQGLGVAYHAKPNVRAVVTHQVNQADLTALLYAQGYSKAEIVI